MVCLLFPLEFDQRQDELVTQEVMCIEDTNFDVAFKKCLCLLISYCCHGLLLNDYFRCKFLKFFLWFSAQCIEHFVHKFRSEGNQHDVFIANCRFQLMNWIRAWALERFLCHSKFGRHRVWKARLDAYAQPSFIMDPCYNGVIWNQNMIYAAIDYSSTDVYVGVTNRGERRWNEHVRDIVCPNSGKDLPCYRVLRRRCHANVVWVPFCCQKEVDYVVLSVAEADAIRLWHSSLNMPYVRKFHADVSYGSKHAIAIVQKDKPWRLFTRLASRAGVKLPSSARFHSHVSGGGANSLVSLAVKLGNLRPKGWSQCARVRYLASARPWALLHLIPHCHRILDDKSYALALRRIESGSKKTVLVVSAHLHSLMLNWPYVKGLSHEKIWMQCYSEQLKDQLLAGQKLFVNIREFMSSADLISWPCSCAWMQRHLEVPVSSVGHCCVRPRATARAEWFP